MKKFLLILLFPFASLSSFSDSLENIEQHHRVQVEQLMNILSLLIDYTVVESDQFSDIFEILEHFNDSFPQCYDDVATIRSLLSRLTANDEDNPFSAHVWVDNWLEFIDAFMDRFDGITVHADVQPFDYSYLSSMASFYDSIYDNHFSLGSFRRIYPRDLLFDTNVEYSDLMEHTTFSVEGGFLDVLLGFFRSNLNQHEDISIYLSQLLGAVKQKMDSDLLDDAEDATRNVQHDIDNIIESFGIGGDLENEWFSSFDFKDKLSDVSFLIIGSGSFLPHQIDLGSIPFSSVRDYLNDEHIVIQTAPWSSFFSLVRSCFTILYTLVFIGFGFFVFRWLYIGFSRISSLLKFVFTW